MFAVLGFLIAVWALGWATLGGLTMLARAAEKGQPDPAMPTTGVYFRSRGVSTFDRRKYLECRLVLARREMAAANQRYRELRAALGDESLAANVLPMRRAK